MWRGHGTGRRHHRRRTATSVRRHHYVNRGMALAFSFVLGSAASRAHLFRRVAGSDLLRTLAAGMGFHLRSCANLAAAGPLVHTVLDGPAMSLLGAFLLGLALYRLTKLIVFLMPLGVLVNAAAVRSI